MWASERDPATLVPTALVPASGPRANICSVRWNNLTVDAEERARLPGYREEAVVRHYEAPGAVKTRFYEIRSKSIINRVPDASQVPFRWTINPYRGCTHACAWCFARPTHKYLDFNAGRDFEREIVVKVNAPELLRAELAKRSWKGEHIALGTNTDPYQWVEGRYKLMPGIWEAMRDAANPCSILTKSPLLLRDLELMKEINAVAEFSAALSVPTLDEKAWRATEPHTPNPRARLEAVAELTRAGIRTGVLVAPLQPGINDSPEQVSEILELASEAGAAYVTGIALHLRGEVKQLWFEWLRAHRPDLVPVYERLYRRGAYMPQEERRKLARLVKGPDADPETRMRGRLARGPRQRDSDEEVHTTATANSEHREGARLHDQGRLF
jgi:DNA repair photolyase